MSSDVEVDYVDSSYAPEDYAPWYKQFQKLSDGKKRLIAKEAIRRMEEHKDECVSFIVKHKCELVGIMPRVEYSLIDAQEGETDVTWIHSFSMPTLLYWCARFQFAFFVNANLEHNDTVLNKQKGNKKQQLRGFTS